MKQINVKITGIHTEPVITDRSFTDIASYFADSPGTVVLLSGGDLDSARYHILAARPWLTFTGRGHDMILSTKEKTIRFNADPFKTLGMILNEFHLNIPDIPPPISAGLFGYLSYDLKDHLEKLPRTSIDDLSLPHICLFAPSFIIVHDKKTDSTRLSVPERISGGKSYLSEELAFLKKILASDPPAREGFAGNADGFKSNFTKPEYRDAIKQIKKYIASGHVYQVNMSQRFEMDFQGDSFSLFKTLYNANPASFFAYINAGSHQIVSTSPERFIRQTGKKVETRPIKGTRPRGKSSEEDKKLGLELKESKKDDAELSMIVDLLRNDLGKVCEAGSVRVSQHKMLELYQNVYHLVSIVEGTLDTKYNSVDFIAATFPGGSITGCPKIRSMEIIDELEPNRRHIYTGSIGYISFHETMDLSIAIRTATIYDERIIFSVGGGIVFDSDPDDEFEETMHKGRTLIEVFRGKEKNTGFNKNYVWINGSLLPLEDACIPVSDLGFQYGYGFFETIRVVNGKAKYIREHIARFHKTWKHLFSGYIPDLTWDDIINQVIVRNNLEKKTAAVKIIATKGDKTSPPFNHKLVVMARPYVHRLEAVQSQGLNLAGYPMRRQTPLADHKTLNYLYYVLAGEWAKTLGADEALIFNPDGSVSETNTANILLINDKTVILPLSPYVLPGVMEKVVCKILTKWGYSIIKKPVFIDDLFSVDNVIITNSLMGAVPVLAINKKRLPPPLNLWKKVNGLVL